MSAYVDAVLWGEVLGGWVTLVLQMTLTLIVCFTASNASHASSAFTDGAPDDVDVLCAACCLGAASLLCAESVAEVSSSAGVDCACAAVVC